MGRNYPDYKNWMPKGMIYATVGATLVFLICWLIFGLSPLLSPGIGKNVLGAVFLIITIICTITTIWMVFMYHTFSYEGKRQMSRQIIEGTADYVKIPKGGKGLDIGCGSGALSIAVAKRNPGAQIQGIDRWGKEYASFSKNLCEENARAEGVTNVSFAKGNAVKLDFANESFDAVFSNYVYHNIPSGDRQAILLETLRVLKKGGTFAIHDIMSKGRYGDMQAFVAKLRDMGYEKVELIDTTQGKFMSGTEALLTELRGSKLLVGKK